MSKRKRCKHAIQDGGTLRLSSSCTPLRVFGLFVLCCEYPRPDILERRRRVEEITLPSTTHLGDTFWTPVPRTRLGTHGALRMLRKTSPHCARTSRSAIFTSFRRGCLVVVFPGEHPKQIEHFHARQMCSSLLQHDPIFDYIYTLRSVNARYSSEDQATTWNPHHTTLPAATIRRSLATPTLPPTVKCLRRQRVVLLGTTVRSTELPLPPWVIGILIPTWRLLRTKMPQHRKPGCTPALISPTSPHSNLHTSEPPEAAAIHYTTNPASTMPLKCSKPRHM